MTAVQEVSDAEIARWKTGSCRYLVIAAHMAEWAAAQERHTVLPAGEAFPFAGKDTWWRAKRFLAGRDVIRCDHGYYQVA